MVAQQSGSWGIFVNFDPSRGVNLSPITMTNYWEVRFTFILNDGSITASPTPMPTANPTSMPSANPTVSGTANPSSKLSSSPSSMPSSMPTYPQNKIISTPVGTASNAPVTFFIPFEGYTGGVPPSSAVITDVETRGDFSYFTEYLDLRVSKNYHKIICISRAGVCLHCHVFFFNVTLRSLPMIDSIYCCFYHSQD